MSRNTADPDDAIRSTDDDAAASRLSAVSLGYLADPYTTLLYKPPRDAAPFGPGPSPHTTRKAPLINVGTHHRTLAIDLLVHRFLERADGQGQVVSLGAGSDSRFWRLCDKGARMSRYVEVDFPHLTSLKAQRIARSPKLSAKLAAAGPSKSGPSTNVNGGTITPSSLSASATPTPTPRSDPSPSVSFPAPAPPSASHLTQSSNAPSGSMPPPTAPSKPYTIAQSGSSLLSPVYALIPLDLRHDPSASLSEALLPHLDTTKPVLFIAECVFCYMTPRTSAEIIRWFGERFASAAGVVYEMCGLTDTFGQVMRRNLAARGLSLPGSEPFPDVASQAQRFVSTALGPGAFERSGAKSLWEIRQEVIDPAELARISKLEFLDEIEELRLVLGHYCVAWGSKGMPGLDL